MTEITIVSSDDKTFKTKLEALKCCQPIETFFTNEKPEVPCKLAHPGRALEKIIAFCEHYQGQPVPTFEKPIHAKKYEEVIKDEFLCKLLDVPKEQLFEILMATSFLVLKNFEDLVACAIAVKLVGRTTEEIRKDFEIENDFTPEEEKALKDFFMFAEEIWP